MSRICRYSGDPRTRHVVNWRHRVPSHELMMLGLPEFTDFSCRKTDRRIDTGKWFWQS